MNITEYISPVIGGVGIIFLIVSFLQSSGRIKWLQKLVAEQQATIKELNNRLMAKNYDQYQMYDQPVTEPLFAEPEEIFNEEAVGKISGKERILDA